MQCIRGARKSTARTLGLASAVALSAILSVSVAAAQDPAPATSTSRPPPQQELMTTADGVQLVTEFYPSTAGKESVPVILVHAFGGSRLDMRSLAVALQAAD